MKVLLLDNYDSFTHNIAQIVKESNLCELDIKKNDKVKLDEIAEYDKLILSPGPDIPQNSGLMPQILGLYYDKMPILGICLGMQAIVENFGGKIFKMDKVYHGIQVNVNIIKNSLIFSGLENTFQTGVYHSWAVSNENFPKELTITAISDDGIIMAVEHKDLALFGLQFHPESYMTPKGKKIIENWLKL